MSAMAVPAAPLPASDALITPERRAAISRALQPVLIPELIALVVEYARESLLARFNTGVPGPICSVGVPPACLPGFMPRKPLQPASRDDWERAVEECDLAHPPQDLSGLVSADFQGQRVVRFVHGSLAASEGLAAIQDGVQGRVHRISLWFFCEGSLPNSPRHQWVGLAVLQGPSVNDRTKAIVTEDGTHPYYRPEFLDPEVRENARVAGGYLGPEHRRFLEWEKSNFFATWSLDEFFRQCPTLKAPSAEEAARPRGDAAAAAAAAAPAASGASVKK